MRSNVRSPLALVMIGLIRVYQAIPKPTAHCRYHPTCSSYALEAVRLHGALRGGWMTVRRLSRCHPWGGTGLDPVPPARDERTVSPPPDPSADADVGTTSDEPPLGTSAIRTGATPTPAGLREGAN